MNAEKHYVLNNEVVLKVLNIEHNELLKASTALVGLKLEAETGVKINREASALSVLKEYISNLPSNYKKAFAKLVELGLYKEKYGKRKKISIDYGDKRRPKSATD
tara:strand:- start:175 stop:489 length:315 start_codon:yes stop_codon:yes gene_type:complete